MSRNELQEPRVVRAFPEDLERVLASLSRTSERTKEWMRAYFVEGKSTVEIARIYGVEPQHVGNKVRAVRAKLAEQASPMQYVEATLSLPIVLVQELQALYNDSGVRASRDLAEDALQPVLKAVTAARKKLREGR
jgi:predicted DNA-binding protein YlxM (UPF0122 family)